MNLPLDHYHLSPVSCPGTGVRSSPTGWYRPGVAAPNLWNGGTAAGWAQAGLCQFASTRGADTFLSDRAAHQARERFSNGL